MSFEANKVQLSTYNHAQIGVKRANQCSISMPPDYLIAFLQGNEVKKKKRSCQLMKKINQLLIVNHGITNINEINS